MASFSRWLRHFVCCHHWFTADGQVVGDPRFPRFPMSEPNRRPLDRDAFCGKCGKLSLRGKLAVEAMRQIAAIRSAKEDAEPARLSLVKR